MRRRRPGCALAALALVACVVLAGCGGDADDPSGNARSSSSGTTGDARTGAVTSPATTIQANASRTTP